jgi:hypothetical protein
MLIGFPQVYNLLKNNPYIDNVWSTDTVTQNAADMLNEYDLEGYMVYAMGRFTFFDPPPVQAQKWAGVNHPSPEYEVYTTPERDEWAKDYIRQLKDEYGDRPVVAWMSNWRQKAFRYTEEEYWTAANDPAGLTGYGKENRNIQYIINFLSDHFIMVEVGVPDFVSQFDTAKGYNCRTFEDEASLIKHCDAFIGTEGGLANLAAGVGTRTLLTHEFTWQCYGPRGVIMPRPADQLKLGPVYYFPDAGHQYLPLYKTDEELAAIYFDLLMGDT